MIERNEIELSVVIPTYNRSQFLQEMLEALSKQTLAPDRYEVIVVVDGSTDGTVQMLESLETPYKLDYIWQDNAGTGAKEFSSGVSVARNNGVAKATGDVILFMDDDLIPITEFLESHLNYYRDDKKVVVLGRLLPSDRPGKFAWTRWEERVFAQHYAALHEGRRTASGWRLYSANFSVGRELFDSMNGFDLEMGHIRGEDVDLGLRMEQAGATFHFSWEAAAEHRGFRPFQSWIGSAYILGVRDVELARRRGYQNLLDQQLVRANRTSSLFRPVVRAFVASGNVRRFLNGGMRFVGGTADRMRMDRVADRSYSLMFMMQQWRGMAEAFGSTADMYHEAKLAAVRRNSEQSGGAAAHDRYTIKTKPDSDS